MTEEKACSRGLGLVKLDFLIGTNGCRTLGGGSGSASKAEIPSENEAKSLRNKYFTSKSLFPKDLAGMTAKVFIPKDRE